jgi:hypothetical protein
MAEYLPDDWNGKRVRVWLGVGGGFEARLVDNNEGGMNIEGVREDPEERPARRAFVPWAAVRFVELIQVPREGSQQYEESQQADLDIQMGRAW